MPAGGFKTFTAGAVLTASEVNAYLMQGVLVFANEAARDTAVTSPVEGMVAYITAPTVAAASGGTTSVPSGIRTIYNGSVWVCVTPVGAQTNNAGSTTSASFTGTLSGSPGTNPAVTLTTGTTALISVSALLYGSTAGNCFMGVAVSGASTVAASTPLTAYNGASGGITSGRSFILTGLTAGSNTFTLNYQGGAFTANFQDRGLIVQGIA